MPEREKNFSPYQPFVEHVSGLSAAEAKELISGEGKNARLTDAGMMKLKDMQRGRPDDERLRQFQEMMVPVMAALIYQEMYREGKQGPIRPGAVEPAVLGVRTPATAGEARGTSAEDLLRRSMSGR
jgi:hypothetical protein